MSITKRNSCFCYSRARSLEESGCGIALVSQWCHQRPELCLFFIFHVLVQWPYDCRMQGRCSQVLRSPTRQRKEVQKGRGLRETTESVPFYQESRIFPETTADRFLFLSHWLELGHGTTPKLQGNWGAGLV